MLKSSNVFYGWIIVGISTLVFAIVRGVNDAFSVFFTSVGAGHMSSLQPSW
jgi:Flp pilus assembly pilin Flp